MVAPLLVQSLFTYRLSSDVGVGKANVPDDVEFVRFGIACCRTWFLSAGKVNRPGYGDFLTAAVSLPMTGGMDAGLDRAIRGLQKSQEIKVDGIVTASSQLRATSGNGYTYMYLNQGMRSIHPKLYPRIDVVPESGPAVTRSVAMIFSDSSPSGKMQII